MAALPAPARGVVLDAGRRLACDANSMSGRSWNGEIMGHVVSSDLAVTGH
jgi:hypothetical protein